MPINIRRLVDKGGEIDKRMKDDKKELDKIKKKLKAHGKRRDKHRLLGGEYIALLSDSKSSTVDMEKLFEYVKDDFEMFEILCKGAITNIREELTGDQVEDVITETEKKFNKISFS